MVKNSILFVVFGHPVFFYTLLYIERGWIRKCTKGTIKTTLNSSFDIGQSYTESVSDANKVQVFQP